MSIASQFCGQMQPHPAHWWQTPPTTYGAATLTEHKQCAGFSGYAPTSSRPVRHQHGGTDAPECTTCTPVRDAGDGQGAT